MTLREIINFSQIQPKFDKLIKSDFLLIQENLSVICKKYMKTSNSSRFKTPEKATKAYDLTPPTFNSTPKKLSKRKLNITPKKHFSSGKNSKKNSNSSMDPDKLFGVPVKVNLKDIFQGYVSSSDDSCGLKDLIFFSVKK